MKTIPLSPRVRTLLVFLLTLILIRTPLLRTVAAAPQGSSSGQDNRPDPCTLLPDPPGKALGIEKQCPSTGSSNGVVKGDFNGDGLADLAIGVPGSTIGGNANAGLVHVIYGSFNGLTTNTSIAPRAQTFSESTVSSSIVNFPAPAAGDRFGAALASGDFNHDGFSDLAIGVPGKAIPGTFLETPSSMGAIIVVYGSATGLNLGAPAEFDITSAIGFNQVALPSLPPLASFDFSKAQLGASLAWGDFNNDGAGDLVAGAPGLSIAYLGGLNTAASVGGIWHILGAPHDGLDPNFGTRLWTQHSIDPNLTDNAQDHFGASLAAGDFNGDGFDDIAVGVPYKTTGSASGAGMVAVVYGSYLLGLNAPNPDFTEIGEGSQAKTGDHFGIAMAAAQLKGIGTWALAIGAPQKALGPVAQAGLVYVEYGLTPGTTMLDLSSAQEWDQDKLGGASRADTGDQFGSALAFNDFNGDGYPDLAIGVPYEDVIVNGAAVTDAGEVDVIYSSGTLTTAGRPPQVWTELSPTGSNHFGASLTAWNFGRNELTGSAPLLISHATADLAVGIPDARVSGASGAGAVDVIYGSYVAFGNGLVPTARQVLTQATFGSTPQPGANFGKAIY